MNDSPNGSSSGRLDGQRAADGHVDDTIRTFKQDLRTMLALAGPSGRPPKIRSIVRAIGGGSTSTISNALNADDRSLPSVETVRKLATAYDPEGLDSWLERREQVAALTRSRATVRKLVRDIGTPLVPMPASERETGPGQRNRRLMILLLAAVVAIAVIVITIVALMYEKTPRRSPNASADARVPTDYSDPSAAGCVDAGSERLLTRPISGVDGLVSIVYSPNCDAYWARAERADGREVGNYIDVALVPQDSTRRPVKANDANAAVVYTYLLTTGDASGFCVDATFWTDGKATIAPEICVNARR